MPVIAVEQLAELGEQLREAGRTVVLTNGHFDLFHVGHLRYLQAARELGDVLVVAVNDDQMTRQRKGPDRPVFPAEERAELLAGLRCVDYVTIFHEPTASEVAAALKPDVYVKGGDYGPGGAALPEAEIVEGLGGRVVILPLTDARSTSSIIEAVRAGRGVR